jgi:hypothetical protein
MTSGDIIKQPVECAFEKALYCSECAEEAASPESRALYRHLRDSWIEVANNLQVYSGLGGVESNGQLRNLLEPGRVNTADHNGR